MLSYVPFSSEVFYTFAPRAWSLASLRYLTDLARGVKELINVITG